MDRASRCRPGAETPIVCDPAKAGEQARQLIDIAVANFTKHRALGQVTPELRTGAAVRFGQSPAR